MTDLEPSSDWRTWSITVPSPASEQSVTSSPLQTSATLYSIFQIIATPFLKFFSIFLSFFFFVHFLPAPRFFNPRLLFSASTLSLVPRFLYPRFRAYHLSDSCQRFRAFHTAYTQIIHKLSAPHLAYFCVFCTFTHLFSPTIPLIFFFFRLLLSRFSTIQCLTSDVRCFARFLFCSPCSSVCSVYGRLYVLPSSPLLRFSKHGRLAHAGGFAQLLRIKKDALPASRRTSSMIPYFFSSDGFSSA